MYIYPYNVFGDLPGTCPPLITKKGKKCIFLTGNQSCLLIYSLENFKTKDFSPSLHPFCSISNIVCIRNRTFLTIGGTLHLLSFTIPITRFSIFKNPITSFFLKKDVFFCFSKKENKGIFFYHFNFKILSQIFFSKNISIVQLTNENSKNLNLYVGTVKGEIEIWSLTSFQKIFLVTFFPSFLIKSLKPMKNLKKIAIENIKQNFIILNFLKNKPSLVLKRKRKNFLGNLTFFLVCKKKIFFFLSKFFFSWNFFNNKIFKEKRLIHQGEIFIKSLKKKEKSWLTMGLKDNSFAIYKFESREENFKLIRFKIGNFWPKRLNQKIKNFNGIFISLDSGSLFSLVTISRKGTKLFSRKNFFPDFYSKILLESKFRSEKKTQHWVLNQIAISRDLFNLKDLVMVFCFFHSDNLWVWKTKKKIFFPISMRIFFDFKKGDQITSLLISPNSTGFLCTSSRGFLFFLKIEDGTLLKKAPFHSPSKIFLSKCKIKIFDFNETGDFFVTGCSHGFIEIWNIDFEQKKRLQMKRKILQIKWETISDSILVSCNDHNLYLILPESFSQLKIFHGHRGIINDFKILGTTKWLISASMDCSIKIWDISKSLCIENLINNFPPVTLNFNLNQDFLVSTYRNTTSLGIWCIKTNHLMKKKVFAKKKKRKTSSIFLKYMEDTLSPILQEQKNSKERSFQKIFSRGKFWEINLKKREKEIKNYSEKKSLNEKKINHKNYNAFFEHEIFNLFLSPIFHQNEKNFKRKKFIKNDLFVIQAINIENHIEKVFKDFYLFQDIKIETISLGRKNFYWLFVQEKHNLLERVLVEIKRMDFLFESFFYKNFF